MRRAATAAKAASAHKARLAAMSRADRLLLEIQLAALRQRVANPRNKIARKSK
jgi:hypothetical protein